MEGIKKITEINLHENIGEDIFQQHTEQEKQLEDQEQERSARRQSEDIKNHRREIQKSFQPIDTSGLHLVAAIWGMYFPQDTSKVSEEEMKVLTKKRPRGSVTNTKRSSTTHVWGYRDIEEFYRPNHQLSLSKWRQCYRCFVWRIQDSEYAANIWSCEMENRSCREPCDYCKQKPCKCQSSPVMMQHAINTYHIPVGFTPVIQFRKRNSVIGDPWMKYTAYCQGCGKTGTSMDRRRKVEIFLQEHVKHNPEWNNLKVEEFSFGIDKITLQLYRYYQERQEAGMFPEGLEKFLDNTSEEEIGEEAWKTLTALLILSQQHQLITNDNSDIPHRKSKKASNTGTPVSRATPQKVEQHWNTVKESYNEDVVQSSIEHQINAMMHSNSILPVPDIGDSPCPELIEMAHDANSFSCFFPSGNDPSQNL